MFVGIFTIFEYLMLDVESHLILIRFIKTLTYYTRVGPVATLSNVMNSTKFVPMNTLNILHFTDHI